MIIESGNGLAPGRRQAIICTNAGALLIESLRTNNEMLIEIHIFLFKKMRPDYMIASNANIFSKYFHHNIIWFKLDMWKD